MHAIVVADDVDEKELLSFALRKAGWSVATSADLERVLATWSDHPADLLVVMISGAEPIIQKQVKAVRDATSCGLMLIVEQSSEAARSRALVQGADAMLERPVSTSMIVAQATALGRRVQSVPSFVLPRLELEQLSLDPSVRTVTVGGSEPQRLTRLEFQLLYVLMTNRGHVVPAEVLVERVWGYSGEGDRDLVRGLVSRVRQKLQSESSGKEFIETIPGVGYRFTSDEL